MKTRTGKIARLPRNVRDELNARLEESEPGPKILAWLNGLREVKRVLKEEFGGDPITKQNLSHWRQNGFRDWLAHEDLRAGLGGLREFIGNWEEGEDLEVIDEVAAFLAARFAALLSRWDGEESREFAARARILNGVCAAVVRLQQQMHRTRRETHEFQCQVEKKHEEEKGVLKQRLIQPFYDMITEPMMAKLFGGGTAGQKIAKYVQAVKGDRLDSKDAELDLTPEDKFADPEPMPKSPDEAALDELEELAKAGFPPSPTQSKAVQPSAMDNG